MTNLQRRADDKYLDLERYGAAHGLLRFSRCHTDGGLKGADGRVPQPLLDAFATFQSELRVFSAECDAFNEKAEGASFPHCFGLWCWNPKYLETSVSV